jgi:N4-gp56 family major capsid protein
MAVDTIPASHELAVQQWEEGLEAEVLKKTHGLAFMGKRSDSLFQMRDRLTKNAGESMRIGLRMQNNSAPKSSGTTIEGTERVLDLYYADFRIDEFADAFRWRNIMDRQRVTFEHRDEAKAALSDLLSNAFDVSVFNQLAGVPDPGGAVTFEGNNPIIPPDNNHILTEGGGADTVAGELSITSADVFNLDMISRARQKAKLLTPAIRPARIPGFSKPYYVQFVHPWQAFDMKESDSRWDRVHMALLQAGKTEDNPLFTGALGVWDDTLIVENTRVPSPGDSTDGTLIRRGIFCGAQSLLCGWGRIGGNPNRFRWVEKLFDFDREMGIMGGFVAGLKKSVFRQDLAGPNFFDFATIVTSTGSPNES